MSIIKKPKLPPKAGYTMIEVNGIQEYKKVMTAQDTEIAQLREIIDIMLTGGDENEEEPVS